MKIEKRHYNNLTGVVSVYFHGWPQSQQEILAAKHHIYEYCASKNAIVKGIRFMRRNGNQFVLVKTF